MANNTVGFFQWIREGVRRSVLLGFSDAVEQIGAPEDGHVINPQLASVLRPSTPALENHTAAEARPAARPERKRLGRSLEQLRDNNTKSTG